MSNGKTYGIAFPFNISNQGKYLRLTQTANDEIRTDLIHLLLTRKGSRYFLPDFGTRLYEYIFEYLYVYMFSYPTQLFVCHGVLTRVHIL